MTDALIGEENLKDIEPVAKGIFSFTEPHGLAPHLVGGKCKACDHVFFPRPPMCPDCLGEISYADLGAHGSIYSYTIVRTKPPFGLPAPYAVGYIDLEVSGLRIFSLLDPEMVGRLHIGQKVILVVDHLGHDGHGVPRLRPFFTPLNPQKGSK